jgi:hypothetical protein
LTNDAAKISGALTSGGALVVTNIGATALAAGDNFKLFNAQISFQNQMKFVSCQP